MAKRRATRSKLESYERRRNFERTPEPKGGQARAEGKSFVVQKHDASRLHYDFRLELDGVLKSWAVPKGPSYDPRARRLAVQTEDHPLEYGSFEGVIPKGEYGGGTVMVWDSGTWQPETAHPDRDLENGRLSFRLDGKKLKGKWHLVRTRGQGGEKQPTWLLVKSKDALAQPSTSPEVVDLAEQSVQSGRGLQEIARAADRIWSSKEGEARRFRLSNPTRVLYPDVGVSKRELAEYYIRVADVMLPHVVNRPLTIVRCPNGYDSECFYQKHIRRGVRFIRPVDIAEDGGRHVEYAAIDDVMGLLALVQLASLEIHTWGAHADDPELPDQLTFDLDPGEGTAFARVIEGAREVRKLLNGLGLQSFVKTTGGKGLHVVLPVERGQSWDETKLFAKGVAEHLSRRQPERYLSSMSKAKRRGRVYIDYLRNGRGATAIAAFSVRARAGAPVSVPLAWDELGARLRPSAFTVRSVPARLSALDRDPWEGFFGLRQSLRAGLSRLL